MNCAVYQNLTEESVAEKWIGNGWSSTFFVLLAPVVTVFGLFNNFLFVFTVFRIRRMKTSLNGFLINLAAADSLFLIITACIYIASYNSSIRRLDYPVSSPLGCLGVDISVFLWYFVSISFVTAVSIERYYAVSRPLRHRSANAKKKSRTVRLVGITWIIGIIMMAINIPYFLVNESEHCLLWPDSEAYSAMPLSYTVCRSNQDPYVSTTSGSISLTAYIIWGFSFTVVVAINFTLYVLIIVNVWKSDNRKKIQLSASNRAERASVQVALTLVVNGTLVLLCQSPYHIYHFSLALSQYSNGSIPLLPGVDKVGFSQETFAIFAMGGLAVNAAINPWIYALGSRFYREAFIEALGLSTCCRLKKNQPSDAHGTP